MESAAEGGPAAAASEWPLSLAGMLREAALYMYWIGTEIAPLKDTGKNCTLRLMCFSSSLSTATEQEFRAPCLECVVLPVFNRAKVLGLNFPICKMRGRFSSRVIFFLLCVWVYVIHVRIPVSVMGVEKYVKIYTSTFEWDGLLFHLESLKVLGKAEVRTRLKGDWKFQILRVIQQNWFLLINCYTCKKWDYSCFIFF